MSIIHAAIQAALQAGDHVSPALDPESKHGQGHRKLERYDTRYETGDPVPEPLSLDQARVLIAEAMQSYADTTDPGYTLLIKALAGTGKTYTAVQLAETLAKGGYRVLYLVPRHDLVPDILRLAQHPAMWYEWQPRRASEDQHDETCRYAQSIETWIKKRYESLSFCQKLCGWDYIKNDCRFHAQKAITQPIIIGQHQHLVSGHAMTFDFLIGDEIPLTVFAHDWQIPARFIAPSIPDADPALTNLLETLQRIAHGLQNATSPKEQTLSGPDLIAALGGSQHVLDTVGAFLFNPVDPDPKIRKPGDVEHIPYRHIPALLSLLDREARLAATGNPYPHRIVLRPAMLHILQKKDINVRLPERVIWLDATADSYLYERVMGWKIKTVEPHIQRLGTVYQVWNSTNNKTSLIDKEKKKTDKVGRLKIQIDHILQHKTYTRPVVISYKDLVGEFAGDHESGYFHAARGTNRYEGTDCLIIVGTPQPSTLDLEKLARMLFWERDQPFQIEPTERLEPYGRSGYGTRVYGFWHDEDMATLHRQIRDAELVQTAYRARPLQHAVDIWLLTSHPISGLEPDQLLSVQELLNAPSGIDSYLWLDVVAFIEDKNMLTTVDLVNGLGMSRPTANKVINLIVDQFSTWHFVPAVERRGHGGRPPKTIAKSDVN